MDSKGKMPFSASKIKIQKSLVPDVKRGVLLLGKHQSSTGAQRTLKLSQRVAIADLGPAQELFGLEP